jgi:diguanylate cyclase (GGDEF)-like protein
MNTLPIKRIFVLVVEDDPADAFILEQQLEAAEPHRFDLTVCPSAAQGLEHLARHGADVVLLDLALPDGPGLDLVEQFRTAAPTVPLVVLTGMQSEATAEETLRAGVQDFLVKGRGDGYTVARSIRYAIERMRSAQDLARLARFDQLTDIANRVLIRETLARALARSARTGSPVGCLFIDLDHFKRVNDTFGHDIGDAVLVEAARRLLDCVRAGDTVGRLGGDEFAVVLQGSFRPAGVASLASRIVTAMGRPFEFAGASMELGASVGVALSTVGEVGGDALIGRADAAMHRAKTAGGSTYRFYDDQMQVAAVDRTRRARELRTAIDRSDLVLHFQPIVDVPTGRAAGMEALVRWRKPSGELVGPLEFIPFAEQAGLICELGAWVLRRACLTAKEWHCSGEHLRLAVNLSAGQILPRTDQPELVETVGRILEETGFDPNRLELEVTEAQLMEDLDKAVEVLSDLRKMGVRISIDDFGTGYSSLAYLRVLPVDVLKIDRAFITHVQDDDRARAIAAAVVGLGHSLSLEIVAEGVETRDQLDFVTELGCHRVQGYYLAKPMLARQFEQWTRQTEWSGGGLPETWPQTKASLPPA